MGRAQRLFQAQYQHISGSDLDQFKRPKTQVIVYPQKFKSGTLIYPPPH